MCGRCNSYALDAKGAKLLLPAGADGQHFAVRFVHQ